MRKVYELATNRVWKFDEHTLPEYALAYAAAELEGLLSSFFWITHAKMLEQLYQALPFVRGKCTLGLGDLATRID